MSTLVPLALRPSLHPAIRQQFLAAVKALDIPSPHLHEDEEYYPPAYEGENYWGRFARMRQAQIDRHLTPGDDYVLWIDADLIRMPVDLYWQLRVTGEGIVAPLVRIDGGGGNYDTAGTRPDYEHRSGSETPAPDVREMFAVGGCVLVPAEVHRRVRFTAQPDNDGTANTEWTSLCVGARELGYTVQWNTHVTVWHANLPEYGEGWH